jgi:hypothetical protein
VGILYGVPLIIVPDWFAGLLGYDQGPEYQAHLLMILGVGFLTPSVFLIAAARDPLRNIRWVKFAILWSALLAVVGIYSMVEGYVGFSQAGVGVIGDAAVAVALLVAYPWQVARNSP